MTSPDLPPELPRIPAWKSGTARGFLVLESLARAFWKPVVWSLAWIGLILMDLPSFFGLHGPAMVGVIFYIGLFWFVIRGAQAFRLPSQRDALRRLERVGPLAHRPLTSAGDRIAGDPPDSALALWSLAHVRAKAEARKARLFAPEPVVTRRDPFALAQAAVLCLVLGAGLAGSQGGERLRQTLMPFQADPSDTAPSGPTIQIVPPTYTGLPTLTLTGGRLPEGHPPLTLPQGATLRVRVPAGWGDTLLPAPVFSIGGQSNTLSALDPQTYAGTFPAAPPQPDAPARLAVRRLGLTRASFDYVYKPDTPPSLTQKASLETLPQGQIRFNFTVNDDYGVRDLTLSLEPDPDKGDMPLGEPVTLSRPVMSPPDTQTDVRPVYDLSAHPWAGLPVRVRFTATDAIGQSAILGPLPLTLPERTFRHPVARRLVALRKELGWTPLGSRMEIARELEDTLARPGLYGGDQVVFLTLRSAASRLFYNDDLRAAREVMDILWDTALRIEDGNLSLATRDLRAARDALEKALRAPNTPDETLAELNERLREALAAYFSELGKELQKRMAQGESIPSLPPDMMADVLDGDALARFLDRLNAESLSGNREKAMEMLSRLQKLTDSLGTSTIAPMPEDLKAMAQGVSDLQELVRRQESLRDQTREQARTRETGEPPSWPDLLPPKSPETPGPDMGPMPPAPNDPTVSRPPQSDTRANRAEQEALRLVLGEIMKEVGAAAGNVPDNLGKAEMDMRKAAQALGDDAPARAIPHQDSALRNLRSGAQSMAKSLSERLSQMTGLAFGQDGGLDPLGRPRRDRDRASGLLDDEGVKIPTEAEKRRVDEILKTLRDRAADPSRPDAELDYLRRLLKQF